MAGRYRKKDAAGLESCSGCGMLLGGAHEYHPHTACALFRAGMSGTGIAANLAAIVEYGMLAQAAGVDLDQAMHDFRMVLK